MSNFFKSIIVYILCFSMLTSVTPAFADTNNEGGFEPGEYSEAVSMLSDLGIIKDTLFAQYDASLNMTRGEFASLAITILGLFDEAKAASYEQKFNDVPADNSYAKEINFAANLGLFNGVSENTFAPDTHISITQAIKVAVCMLGYKEVAEYKGGYPAGYLAVARDIDILEDVVVSNDSSALRGNVIILMYNTLFADIMNINGIKDDSYSYDISEGVNLLTEYHGIYEGEGIVTSNWQYSISGDAEDANYIVINDNRFFTESARASGVVGKNVKYYYKNIGNKDILLTLREEGNDVVNIKADDNYVFDYDKGQYTIIGDNKEYKFRLENYDIVYNCGYIDGNTSLDYENILSPKIGTITLIDNDEDNVYDVVIIEDPDVLIYKSYDAYSEKIYDITDRKRDIALNVYDKIEIADVNGNTVDFSKLTYNTVIMVYKSYDSKNLKLVVCPDYVEGIVSEITPDGIVINENTYTFSPVSRLEGLAPGQSYESIVFPGQSYKFYLDQYNQIVYHDSKTALNTGYIMSIAEDGVGLNSAICAQVYTAAGELSVIPLADKVRIETIDSRSSYSNTEVKAKLEACAGEIYGSGVNPHARLFIQYGLNNDKKMSSIVIPHVLDTKEEYDNPPSNYSFFKLDHILSQFKGPGVNTSDSEGREYHRLGYIPANRSAGLTMTMDESCSIFYVPEFSNNSYQESNFSVQGIKSLPRNEHMYYYPEFIGVNNQLEAYSTDREVRLVNNLVWIKENGHATPITNSAEDLALVTSISNVVSENGEPLVKISVLESKSKYDLYSENLNILSRSVFEDTTLTGHNSKVVSPTIAPDKTGIVPGDLIRFSTNADGYVEDIALMYDSQNHMITYQDTAAFTKHSVQYRNTCGEVVDIYGNYAVLDVYNSSLSEKTTESHIISSYYRIYVYDHKTEEAKVGTADDISIGDKVYFTMYYTQSTDGEIIIYKGGN